MLVEHLGVGFLWIQALTLRLLEPCDSHCVVVAWAGMAGEQWIRAQMKLDCNENKAEL